ncbi:MAG: TolC family protein, partial [Deltaproteobacteria bacterium]
MIPVLGLLSWGTAGAEPWSETELVRQGLSGPVSAADLDAVDARARAERTAVPLLDSPTLDLRHEEAKGDWGATTNAVGATVTVDLGLSPLSYTRAAHLRGDAGEQRGRAMALELACDLRADAADLWAASASATVGETAQGRLESLLDTLAALSEAGDASGYDRDRAALEVVAHEVDARLLQGGAAELRARVSTLVGADVTEVSLAPLAARPALDVALAGLEAHPALEGLVLERDAAKLSRDAARRDQLPDVTLSAGPRWDASPTGGPGSQGFEIGGSVQIPWMDGTRGESRAQAAELAEAEARLVRARAQLEAAVRGAHARVEGL